MKREPRFSEHRRPTMASAPSAVLHAKVLVISHGLSRAQQIAETNKSFEHDFDYWSDVLQAIDKLNHDGISF